MSPDKMIGAKLDPYNLLYVASDKHLAGNMYKVSLSTSRRGDTPLEIEDQQCYCQICKILDFFFFFSSDTVKCLGFV